MIKGKKISAVIVAAGKGTRMKCDQPKQYICIDEKPVLYYTLKAFEQSNVDHIVIVVSEDYFEYVQSEIMGRYSFEKSYEVVIGGDERYESVYQGLLKTEDCDYVLVHDGARPYIEVDVINGVIEEVIRSNAVVVGVKAKDTIKIVDENRTVVSTPERSYVWQIQTPQAFEYRLLKNAYDKVIEQKITHITDDAMVVESATNHPIKVYEGTYRNIKITTPEDLRYDFFQQYLI